MSEHFPHVHVSAEFRHFFLHISKWQVLVSSMEEHLNRKDSSSEIYFSMLFSFLMPAFPENAVWRHRTLDPLWGIVDSAFATWDVPVFVFRFFLECEEQTIKTQHRKVWAKQLHCHSRLTNPYWPKKLISIVNARLSELSTLFGLNACTFTCNLFPFITPVRSYRCSINSDAKLFLVIQRKIVPLSSNLLNSEWNIH